MKKTVCLLTIVFACLQSSFAQAPHAFQADVETIKKYDKMYTPPANPILFIGSSSIRKWNNLERVFAAYDVMNRGIGGAVINDITYYLNDIAFPYHPRQIFIYVGDNDMPNKAATPDTILERTQLLISGIREKLPEVPVVYIAIKPSPSREQYLEKVTTSNDLIKKWIATQKNIKFVDIVPPMLSNSKPRPELFLSDMLHLNSKGYDIWEKAIKPLLLKK